MSPLGHLAHKKGLKNYSEDNGPSSFQTISRMGTNHTKHILKIHFTLPLTFHESCTRTFSILKFHWVILCSIKGPFWKLCFLTNNDDILIPWLTGLCERRTQKSSHTVNKANYFDNWILLKWLSKKKMQWTAVTCTNLAGRTKKLNQSLY